MKQAGLLGENIQYSKSPNIHNKYYKENNIELTYSLLDKNSMEMNDFIKNFPKDLIGFNVTVPYKEKILPMLNEIKYPANLIKAVNTVVIYKGKLIGYNTDYFGFIKSLEINNVVVKDKTVLILGNGGAAKAVYYGIRDLEAKFIDFACRNTKKCRKEFNDVRNIININKIKDISEYDLVINATILGNINHNISPIEIDKYKRSTVLYDLNYIPKINKFLSKGIELGLKVVNGEDMLYHQAICAINLWNSLLKKEINNDRTKGVT